MRRPHALPGLLRRQIGGQELKDDQLWQELNDSARRFWKMFVPFIAGIALVAAIFVAGEAIMDQGARDQNSLDLIRKFIGRFIIAAPSHS